MIVDVVLIALRRYFRVICLLLVISGVFILCASTGFVESHVFFPDREIIITPDKQGLAYEDVFFQTEDNIVLNGWFVGGEEKTPYLLFFHGNAGNISHRIDNLILLNRIGLNVFIFDYRGYGKSKGEISEAGFYLDADAAYEYVAKRAAEKNNEIIIFGRSLGTVAAVHVAASNRCSAVILESAFTNLGDMAACHYPIPFLSRLLKGRFDTLATISKLHQPLLFIHGDDDAIVPYSMGRTLFDAARAPKEFYTVTGAGHNDVYETAGTGYNERLNKFLRILHPERIQ